MSEEQTIADRIKDIVVDQLGVNDDQVTPASNLIEDLGADSLDQVELVMALEEEFDVEVTEDEVEAFKTVGDVIKFMETKLA